MLSFILEKMINNYLFVKFFNIRRNYILFVELIFVKIWEFISEGDL